MENVFKPLIILLCPDLVISLLSTDNENEKEKVSADLADDLASLKEIAHTLKKLPVSDKNAEKVEPWMQTLWTLVVGYIFLLQNKWFLLQKLSLVCWKSKT